MDAANKIQFWDTSQYINAPSDGSLWLASGVAISNYIGGVQASSLSQSIFTIGGENAGTDYRLQFKGEDNIGFIKWWEDEDYFEIEDDTQISGYLNITEGNLSINNNYQCHNINCSSYTYHNGTHLTIQT